MQTEPPIKLNSLLMGENFAQVSAANEIHLTAVLILIGLFTTLEGSI